MVVDTEDGTGSFCKNCRKWLDPIEMKNTSLIDSLAAHIEELKAILKQTESMNRMADRIIADAKTEIKNGDDAEAARRNGNGHKNDTNIKGRPA